MSLCSLRFSPVCALLCIFLYGAQIHAYAMDDPQPIVVDTPDATPNKPYKEKWAAHLGQDILQDFKHYVEPDRLLLLGGAFAGSALLANTDLDKRVSRQWQSRVRSRRTDRFFDRPQRLGGLSCLYAPLYLVTMGLGHLAETTQVGNVMYHWGYRSLRTFFLGGPQQALFTYLIGSGRPNRQESSTWKPFKHNTGVSGHTFYGAIPLLNAAMMTDPPVLRYTLYALSTLPGISRINSDYHYLSQVFLGWSIAYLSAASVYDTDAGREPKFQVHATTPIGWDDVICKHALLNLHFYLGSML